MTSTGSGQGTPQQQRAAHAALAQQNGDLRAYAEVTRERVDNLAERVAALEAKINTLTMLIIGQMLSFLFAVALLIMNHTRF